MMKLAHWTNTIPLSKFNNQSKKDRMPTAQELAKQTLRLIVFQI